MVVKINQAPVGLVIPTNVLEEIVFLVCEEVKLKAQSISFIFSPDKDLAEMHGKYLDDPSKTDVITFNLDEESVEGEVYISFDRAKEQSIEFGVTFEEEIVRLMIHGILHLSGYDDIEEMDQKEMKNVENRLVTLIVKKVLYPQNEEYFQK